jgi:hypothetical protein
VSKHRTHVGLTLDDKSDGAHGEASSRDQASHLLLIRKNTSSEGHDICHSIRRHREQLSLQIAVAKALDDGGREEGQGGDADAKAEVSEVVNPKAEGQESLFGVVPIELCVAWILLMDNSALQMEEAYP